MSVPTTHRASLQFLWHDSLENIGNAYALPQGKGGVRLSVIKDNPGYVWSFLRGTALYNGRTRQRLEAMHAAERAWRRLDQDNNPAATAPAAPDGEQPVRERSGA